LHVLFHDGVKSGQQKFHHLLCLHFRITALQLCNSVFNPIITSVD
jgi:hypothetical protein